MNKKTTVPGLNLSELRDLAYRVKPVVKANERLFFVKESDLTAPIAEQEKVLEADMLSLLGESEYEAKPMPTFCCRFRKLLPKRFRPFAFCPATVRHGMKVCCRRLCFVRNLSSSDKNIFLPVPIVTEGRNCVPSKPDRHLKMTLTPLAAKREALIFLKTTDSKKGINLTLDKK